MAVVFIESCKRVVNGLCLVFTLCGHIFAGLLYSLFFDVCLFMVFSVLLFFV